MQNDDKHINKINGRRQFLKNGMFAGCALCCGGFASPLFAEGKNKLWKWSKEAKYYSTEGKTTFCELCPQECIIYPDKKGDCRTRINKNGKLYSLVYGNPCSVNVDPIEKKPLYHFLPKSSAFSIATAGCNLSCMNCQNWSISQSAPEETRNMDLMPNQVVKAAQKYNCDSIAYTYSEPIVFYEYMYDSAKIAKEKGIKNVLITAGYINEKPLRDLCKVTDAANIDLKSFSDDIYKKLNGGTLKPVLRTLEILTEENVWIEITNLIVPGWTDDLKMIRKMCKWLVKSNLDEYPLHFSRFHPMYKLTHLPQTPISTLEKAVKIAKGEGMKYVYLGNVPGSNAENTYCHKCSKLLIKRKGYYILENNLENGKCKYCKVKIPGVWGE
ncbi:AmmeMemoRadiSam system radical SAM enzyme [Bacteroidota bacterium]